MRVIPVIDVMGGQVVRAVGGRRSEYQPIQSRLTDSTELVEVARAVVAATRSDELYVADLDAITGTGSNRSEICDLAWWVGVTVWADLGIRFQTDLVPLSDHRRVRPVLGSETVSGPDVVSAATRRSAFSLDLRQGTLIGDLAEWRLDNESPVRLAERAVEEGIRTLIVLDVTAVGGGTGPQTGELCRELRRYFPTIELITGGGVRGWDDIRRLEDAGADGVLVASALHDGMLL